MASIELTWYTTTFLVVLLIAGLNWFVTGIRTGLFSVKEFGPNSPNVQPVKTDLIGLFSERFPQVTKYLQFGVYGLVTVAAIGLIIVMATAHVENFAMKKKDEE